MDLFTAAKLYEKRTEKFEGAARGGISAMQVLIYAVSLAVCVYAVYLSWSCNTAAGVNVVLKVVYAIFAFIFGLLYLIFYFIFRAGTCNTLKAAGSAAATNAAAMVGGRRRFR
jgi:hypothetical protein